MERTTHIDQTGRKEAYVKPALISHAPLRDLTAFQSDCDTIADRNLFTACEIDHEI